MRRVNPRIYLFALLVGFLSNSVLATSKEDEPKTAPDVLRLAVGLSDVPSRMIAIGLSSLAKSEPAGFEIDTTWIRADDNGVDRVTAGDSELALLGLDDVTSEALDDSSELRAVMKYWSSDDDGSLGRLLVAHNSVPSERIDALLDIALRDQVVLEAARIDVTKLTPERALTALPIAAHTGVTSYLRRHGHLAELNAMRTSDQAADRGSDVEGKGAEPLSSFDVAAIATSKDGDEEMSKPRRSFTLFFDTADAAIDRQDIQSVAAACRFAATLSRARFVISGHADTVGPDAYNDDLSKRRANAVADAIRNDPRFREGLSVVEFGEQRLAVATADGVAEPKNRRVEITVFEE